MTEVTRSCGIELDELDDEALPGSPVGLAPVALLELLPAFDIVPFTSTFFPTRLDISDALPLSRYVVPLIDDDAPVVPVGFEGLVVDGLLVADPVEDDDPPEVDASVRM